MRAWVHLPRQPGAVKSSSAPSTWGLSGGRERAMSDHRARSLAAAVGLRTSLLISTLALTAHALFLYGQLVGREDDCPGAGRTHVLVLARLDSARRSYPPFHQRVSVILCITHQAGTPRTTLCKHFAVSRRTARTRHHRPRPPPCRLQQHRVRRVGRGHVRLDDGDRSRPAQPPSSYLTSVQDSRAVLGCKTHWCRCRDAGLLSRNTA